MQSQMAYSIEPGKLSSNGILEWKKLGPRIAAKSGAICRVGQDDGRCLPTQTKASWKNSILTVTSITGNKKIITVPSLSTMHTTSHIMLWNNQPERRTTSRTKWHTE